MIDWKHAISDASEFLQTSNGLLWMLYCLSRNPAAQTTLYNEVSAVLPDRAPMTAEAMSTKLPYVKGVPERDF